MADETEDTHELLEAQRRREQAERAQAARADDDEETTTHERRADRAAYLKEKLAEREASEREG